MAEPQKPHMVLGGEKELTFEDTMTFYEKLKGRKPTPEEREKALKSWNKKRGT